MRFTVLTIGKAKHSYVQQGVDHYVKSISTLGEVEIVELKDSESDTQKEAEAILTFLERRQYLKDGKNRIIALDEHGKEFTSVAWSQLLQKWQDEGVSRIIFIIGGAFGLHEKIKKEAAQLFALSKFTFPHDLVRIILLEQIYRALHIQSGSKYHHP